MNDMDLEFSNGKPEPSTGPSTAEATAGPKQMCPASYEEPQRADRSDTHTCDLDDGHTGPHYCELCKSHWLVRVGVVPDQGASGSGREQVALARMDAHLLGTGWVMVTRDEAGNYEYDRVDPVRVELLPPEAAEVDVDVEAAVRRTAAKALSAVRIREQLLLLVKRANLRQDKMQGWIPSRLLKELLEATDPVRVAAQSEQSGKKAKKP